MLRRPALIIYRTRRENVRSPSSMKVGKAGIFFDFGCDFAVAAEPFPALRRGVPL